MAHTAKEYRDLYKAYKKTCDKNMSQYRKIKELEAVIERLENEARENSENSTTAKED